MSNSRYILILAIIISSCSIKNYTHTPPIVERPSEIIKRVNDSKKHIEWLSIKGKVNIKKENQNLNFNIQIKNKRDSLIFASLKAPFGIEVARVQITKDSVYFINRINKTYFIKESLKINELIKSDLSFFDLQDIITASIKSVKKYKIEKDENRNQVFSDNVIYEINNKDRVKKTKLFYTNSTVDISFDNYEDLDELPRKIEMKIKSDDFFEVVITFLNITLNKQESILFEIPASYERNK